MKLSVHAFKWERAGSLVRLPPASDQQSIYLTREDLEAMRKALDQGCLKDHDPGKEALALRLWESNFGPD